MIISIDESGSFTYTATRNSWCVVSAYVFSERIQSKSFEALKKLKKSSGAAEYQEIKLKDVSEHDYFQFIDDLTKLGGVLLAVATDSHLNDQDTVIRHRTIQADKVRENVPRMNFESGKKGVAILADEIDSLSPQLYIQLQCQVVLINDIIHRAILYYVQRDPYTLRKFKWRVDQKNTVKTIYEQAFEKVICPILQTISFREPMIFIDEADYSNMEPYMYSDGEVPEYIEKAYGKKLSGGVNIGKIMREDMSFPNSKKDLAVQIADLLASGIRRCLRSEFTNNHLASKQLGRLMLRNMKGKYPIQYVSFQDHEKVADASIARVEVAMESTAKEILLNA